MDPDVVVPVMFFLIVVGGPIAAWIVSRVLAHQERIEMIRHGVMPPPDPHTMRRAMKYGNWPPGGMAPGPYPYPPYDPSYYAQRQLRRGIQVAFIGLALLVGLSFIGYRGDGDFTPGPWLLGGLVPMFVGIAQIVSAVLGGATPFRSGMQPSNSTNFGPPPQAAEPPPTPTAAGAAPPPPGSYGGWRPGPIPEIEKPPQPPDRF